MYFDYHTKVVELEEGQLTEPAARFVSCLSKEQPTNEDWNLLLLDNGYTQKQITEILE